MKGDNPLCLYHYPRTGIYLYASTEAILTRALNRLRLPLGKPERIELMCGDILKITASGQQAMNTFDASNLILPWGYCSMWPDSRKNPAKNQAVEKEYLDELKSVACCYGYSPDAVDRMLASGFTTDEVEEFLYDGGMY